MTKQYKKKEIDNKSPLNFGGEFEEGALSDDDQSTDAEDLSDLDLDGTTSEIMARMDEEVAAEVAAAANELDMRRAVDIKLYFAVLDDESKLLYIQHLFTEMPVVMRKISALDSDLMIEFLVILATQK
jgi:hypothetical protein